MGYDEASYYLASVADELVVHPYGDVELNGFASEPMFFARAFEKYGVDVQVTRVGKYKSAVEPFVLDRMSDANREQMALLLGDMWNVFLADVGASRGLPAAELQRMADERGVFEAADAKSRRAGRPPGLLRRAAGRAEEGHRRRARRPDLPADRPRRLHPLARGAPAPATGKNRVAVIYAEGEIVDGDDKAEVGGDVLARLLRRARLDKDVKGVVLRVNSPGGSASASEVIQREVRADPREEAGGDLDGHGRGLGRLLDLDLRRPDLRRAEHDHRLDRRVRDAPQRPAADQQRRRHHGRREDRAIRRPVLDLPPEDAEELAIVQGFVDRIYDDFTAKVAESRKLPLERVQELAQGRVWSGGSAKALGLVDEFGGLSSAIEWTAKKAGLGENYGLTFYQEQKTPWQQFLESMARHEERDRAAEGSLLTEARRVASEVERLGRLDDPRGAYARLAFDLQPR